MMELHRTLLSNVLAASAFALPALSQQNADAPPSGPQLDRIAVHRSSGLFELEPGVLHGGGAYYDVRFRESGMRLEPALGTAVAETQYLALRPLSVGRDGEPVVALPSHCRPEQNERTATFAHGPGVRERYAVGVDGIELSWEFDTRPAGRGDLVARYALDTRLPEPVTQTDGSLRFVIEGIGGVTIGGVTGVDALGRKVAGSLRYANKVLELSLPAEFVDRAAYPLVLDPLIGPAIGIWNGPTYSDSKPDCSFERVEDRYLVTFLRTFSSSDIRVRGQLIDRAGALFQGVIWFTTGGASSRPRVATCRRQSRFGVVWVQRVGTQSHVNFRSVTVLGGPSATALSPTTVLANGPQWTVTDADIGAEAGQFQQNYAFVAVWDDTNADRIYARRIGMDASGTALVSSPFAVFNDSTFVGYSQPAIARSAESDGKFMVVARRFWGIGTVQRGISCALVSARNNTVTNRMTIETNTTDEFWSPDVDGYGDEWVVAWRQNAFGTPYNAVSVRSAQLVGGTLQFGAPVTLGGTSWVRLDHPTVGYSHGKTWLGYRENFLGSTALRARGIDPTSCMNCQDLFSAQVPSTDTRVVVATTMSGFDPSIHEGLAVWGESQDVWAQRLGNYGNNGTIVNQGGGCGAGGTQSSTPPNLGMTQLHSSVIGLPATAALTMFNFAIAPSVITCGACEWLQPQVALIVPITTNNSAMFRYSLPCDPGLAGLQFETQWTTYDPGTAACPSFPGFAVTDRQLHTVGQ